MKKIFGLLLFVCSLQLSYAQSKLPLRADTVVVEKAGPNQNANLVIKNATRDSIGGSLITTGNGVTSFERLEEYNIVTHGRANKTGATDVSSIIAAAFAKGYKRIKVPKGIFLINNTIQLPDSAVIQGEGAATYFLLTSNITAFKIGYANGGQGSQFLDFGFLGTKTSGADSSQRAIFIDSVGKCYVHNIRAQNLGGYAVTVTNNGFNFNYTTERLRGNIITDIYVETSLGGVLFGNLAEYNKVSNSTFFKNQRGVFNTGGNNGIHNNNIVSNTIGLYFTGGSNNAHGIASGNFLNHNNSYNIYSDGVTNGFLFDGNMIYAGSIRHENSTGMTYVGGTVAGITVTLNNCTETVFNGVRDFSNTWTVTGNMPTIWNVGETAGSFKLRDVVNGKTMQFNYTNGIGAFTGGRFTFNDSVNAPSLFGASFASGNLNISSNSTSSKGKIIFEGGQGAWDGTTAFFSIGSSAPTWPSRLSMQTGSTVPLDLTLYHSNNVTNAAARILFRNTTAHIGQLFYGSAVNPFAPDGFYFGSDGPGGTAFVNTGGDWLWRANATPGVSELMRLQYNTGRIGVGTATPQQKFHVLGSGLFSDTLYLTGLIIKNDTTIYKPLGIDPATGVVVRMDGWKGAGGGGGGNPFADNTDIIKGSADATKLLRFEVDGFTTGTTRTLTPQNASYTIAGLEISNTFTAQNLFTTSSGGGSTGIQINNSNTASYANIGFNTNNSQIAETGSTFSNGLLGASTFGHFSNATGGILFAAYNAAGKIVFGTGGLLTGNERGRILANGNWLIGTTTDGGQKFQVSGTTLLAGNVSVTGTGVAINSSSGTTNVFGGTSFGIEASSASVPILANATTTTGGIARGLYLGRNGGGGYTPANNDGVELGFFGKNSSGSSKDFASIAAVMTNVTAGSEAGGLQFKFMTGGVAQATKYTINSNGSTNQLGIAEYNSDLRASYTARTLVDWANVKKEIHDSLEANLEIIDRYEFSVGNNTETTLATITPVAGQIIEIEIRIVGSIDDGSGSFQGRKLRVFNSDGTATLTQSSVEDLSPVKYLGSGLSTATFTVKISGSDIIVTVTGETGDNISGHVDVIQNVHNIPV